MTPEALLLREQINGGADPETLREIGYNDYVHTPAGTLEVVGRGWSAEPAPTTQEEIDALDIGLTDEDYRLVEMGISTVAIEIARRKRGKR